MALNPEFIDLELQNLHHEAAVLKTDGWRFIQTHAVYTDDGIDLYYSFMKDGRLVNYKVSGVQKDQPVASITDLFLAAFVFENEARELFGVDMRDIALDFDGGLYAPAIDEPMTIITPEQKAAREKARMAAKKAAEKASAGASSEQGVAAKKVFVMTPERQARLDAKMATMSDDKKAKVEAALKARAAEARTAASDPSGASAPEKPAKAQKAQEEQPRVETKSAPAKEEDAVLLAKIDALPADKASKVRAALRMGDGSPANEPASQSASEQAGNSLEVKDALLEEKLSLMDADAAGRVRAALSRTSNNAEVK